MTVSTPRAASSLGVVQLPSATVMVERVGSGAPIVVVHGEDGSLFVRPFIEALGAHRTVHLIHLPGWGVTPESEHVQDVDDLGLLLIDYAASEFTSGVPVLGLSFGAWVVAQAAVRDQHAFSRVVLVSPVGIKTLGREERSYVDLWATDPGELRDLLYGDRSRMPDLTALDDDDFLRLARANEAVARHSWQPYFHDPKLPHRLARLTSPTLIVTGGQDRFVLEPSFGERWADLIGGSAEHAVLEPAGHRVEEEDPSGLARLVHDFLDTPHA